MEWSVQYNVLYIVMILMKSTALLDMISTVVKFPAIACLRILGAHNHKTIGSTLEQLLQMNSVVTFTPPSNRGTWIVNELQVTKITERSWFTTNSKVQHPLLLGGVNVISKYKIRNKSRFAFSAVYFSWTATRYTQRYKGQIFAIFSPPPPPPPPPPCVESF